MTYYVGILDVGPNGAWGVRIPDVPGCHGGGATPEAAIQDATSALREVAAHHAAKGSSLNKPRKPLDVVRDPDANFEISGDTLVMVPLMLDEARSVKANVSLDAGLLAAIDDEAKLWGLTRSGFLASAAREKIIQRGGTKVVGRNARDGTFTVREPSAGHYSTRGDKVKSAGADRRKDNPHYKKHPKSRG